LRWDAESDVGKTLAGRGEKFWGENNKMLIEHTGRGAGVQIEGVHDE